MSIDLTLLNAAEQAITATSPTCLVTIIEVRGSAPRGVGTAMLVAGQELTGTIGGGRLEFEAIQEG